MVRFRSSFMSNSSTSAIVLLGLLVSGPALAQTTGPASQAQEESESTLSAETAAESAQPNAIVVTGSRLERDGYNAPTPVNIIGGETLENLGITNVGEGLNQLPSFRAATSPSANLFRVGTAIAARTPDLRGLGPTRTLTLVDGRRFVQSSDLGTIDLNAIPSLLVDRTEVVTGGASAAYGADAVAGVVNLILDSKFDGIKMEVSGGISGRSDAKSFYAAGAIGTDFAGGRGHTVFGAEYSWEGGVGDIETRDWGRRHVNFVSNPNYGDGPGGNGMPATIVSPNALFVVTPGGMIANGPLKGIQFDANGNPAPFQFGSTVGGTLMIGGDPAVKRAYFVDFVPLLTPNKHFSAFSHTDFALSDSLNAVFELSYAHAVGGPAQGAAPAEFNRLISIDNAYLPDSVRADMVTAGVATIPVNRYSLEYGPQNIATSTNNTYRVMVGLDGGLFGDWKWDAHYQFGLTDAYLDIINNRVTDRWDQSIDAVVAPGGGIVCRSTLTDPTNGCAPVNYFGINAADPAVVAWAYLDGYQTRKYRQHDFAANVRGTAFHTWAGPVSVAAGGEFRRARYSGTADPLSRANAFSQNYATDLPRGGQDVVEGYIEANVPLLRDSAIGSLDVDGALRQTEYSQTGSATTWKVGAVYRPDEQFMVRVSSSRDIRAPTAAELNPLAQVTSSPLTDPDLSATYPIVLSQSGNPNLSLEKASTFTAGAVFQPRLLSGFSFSVDYYNIRVRDAIDVLSAQQTINLCSAGNTTLCGFVARDPSTGRIETVNSTYQNLSALSTSGFELSADYARRFDDGGQLTARINANYVDHLTAVDATGATQEYSNWTGNPGAVSNLLGVPRWRANAVVGYDNESFGLTAQGRYVPEGLLDPNKIGPDDSDYNVNLPNSANINTVASRFYLDLSARVNVTIGDGQRLQFFAVMNNVFDTDPPGTLRLFGNPLLFDPIGRNFKLGVRARF